ncbi:MAG: hypothetical protein K6D93_00940 [Saccharofermentans sp.]|nr:hypothetical protein [Saccharofermentans sp.]
MKKLSATVSIALILAMAAGTMGCAQKIVFTPTTTTTSATTTAESSEETTTKESESETTTSETFSGTSESSGSSEGTKAPAETTSGTTKSSGETNQTTAENSGLATVSIYNAYKRSFKSGKKTYKTQYPKIMIANVNTTKVNKEIADKFKPIAKKNNSRVGYTYYVRKYLISVVVFVEKTPGNSKTRDYYVYNVSRINGKKLTRAQVLKSLGMKETTFNTKVKASLQNYWKDNFKKDTSAEKKEMEKKSYTTKSLNSAMPYMNTNGKISYVLRQVETPNGKVDIYGTC